MQTELSDIKQAQQSTWSSGNYQIIGNPLMIMAELLCERVRVLPHHRVLDVATGTGNSALAAAHRNATDVTGIDFAPGLIEIARSRAQAEGLGIRFDIGDAEQLPYPDRSFDVVLSSLGVMFTPNQEQSASELVRVTRTGGRIGLACWTPRGFIGQLLKLVGSYVPPPAGIASPVLWGTKERLLELFGDSVDLEAEERDFVFRFRSPQHFADTFSSYYGPIITALNRLNGDQALELKRALADLAASFGHQVEESFEIPSTYLEIVAVRRSDPSQA